MGKNKSKITLPLLIFTALVLPLLITLILVGRPVDAGWPGSRFQLTVDVSPSGGGTVKLNEAVSDSYPFTFVFTSGELVHLEAIAASGYRFTNCSDDLSGTSNSTTIVVDCNKKVTANFSRTKRSWWTISGVILFTAIAVWYSVKHRRSPIGFNTD